MNSLSETKLYHDRVLIFDDNWADLKKALEKEPAQFSTEKYHALTFKQYMAYYLKACNRYMDIGTRTPSKQEREDVKVLMNAFACLPRAYLYPNVYRFYPASIVQD